MMNNILLQKIEELPFSSGCYIYKNSYNEIIYVGKSKCLKKRVKSYFKNDVKNNKILHLIKDITDIEIIVTKTESDALFLECELIKKHRPRYNSQLKRDAKFYYLKIDNSKAITSFSVVIEEDRIFNDFVIYVGTFYNYYQVLELLEKLGDIFNIPTCGKLNFEIETRECLRFHMNKCIGPCKNTQLAVDKYVKIVDKVVNFFCNNDNLVYNELNDKMIKYSNKLEFEKALDVKIRIEKYLDLRKWSKRLTIPKNFDKLFLFFRAYNEEMFNIFYVELGIVKARICLPISIVDKIEIKILLKSFIKEIKNKKYNEYSFEINFDYLREIHANKMSVNLDFDKKLNQLVVQLLSECNEFLQINVGDEGIFS